ncbi:hypothetical protein [Caulobacter sp. 1776]|uniref:hypothetical protein n=1 Tax=Caulobacter sp. 1776 TaxID=3156420 RepID=UPI0033987704
MERLEHLFAQLKAFALTRPIAYGAPTCAAIGVVAGLAMQTGPQDGPYAPEMEPAQTPYEAMAEPIAWPAGKVPDYVIGTDFLRATQPPPVQMASYEEPAYEAPPMPDIPPYQSGQHGPAATPPDPDGPHWASERGDILDVSLPEDRTPPSTPLAAAQTTPVVLADAAATGMTTR